MSEYHVWSKLKTTLAKHSHSLIGMKFNQTLCTSVSKSLIISHPWLTFCRPQWSSQVVIDSLYKRIRNTLPPEAHTQQTIKGCPLGPICALSLHSHPAPLGPGRLTPGAASMGSFPWLPSGKPWQEEREVGVFLFLQVPPSKVVLSGCVPPQKVEKVFISDLPQALVLSLMVCIPATHPLSLSISL